MANGYTIPIPKDATYRMPIPAGATIGGPDPLLRQTKAAAVAGGASPRSTQEPRNLVELDPTGALGRIASGAEAGARAMLPNFSGPPPEMRDVATSGFGPLPIIAEGVAGGYRESRNRGQGVLPSIGAGLANVVGLDAPGIRERAQRGDVAGVVGEGIPAIASAILLPKAGRAAGRTIGAAGDFVDRFSYERPTEIKLPWGLGQIKDTGPIPGGTGAPFPSAGEFYEHHAQELMRRPDELTQAVREGRASRLPTRIPRGALGRIGGIPSPFEGMQSTSPEDVSSIPPITSREPVSLREPEGPLGRITTSTGPVAKIDIKGAETTPMKSLIQEPGSLAPGVKTTFQSYPRESLVEMIRDPAVPYKTKILALGELRRNPGGVDISSIPGVKYLMEEGAQGVPWRNYRR